MSPSKSFLGTGWGFPPTFEKRGKGGGVALVSDDIDVKQSLSILFNTKIGERIMQPSYGADLKSQVFEAMNNSFLTFIADMLRTAIVYHEPRIETERLSVEPDHLEGRLKIAIDYRIRGTNSRFNFVFPFYFKESGRQP